MQSVDYLTGTEKKRCLYVFLQTETESWILTDRPGQGGESMTARQTMDGNVIDSNPINQNAVNSNVIDGIEGDESETDAVSWSILPDSLEYRENIWRDLI